MKQVLTLIALIVSFNSMAGFEMTYNDQVEVKEVVMKNEILIEGLTELYSDFYFDELMIAKKAEKNSWADNLRKKLDGCRGIYRI